MNKRIPFYFYRSLLSILFFFPATGFCQLNWIEIKEGFGNLPDGFKLYKTTDSLDGKPFIAWCAVADLKNKKLIFNTDTTYKRRLTPAQFYKKNNNPLLVVNGTFFSFVTNQNLNVVIKDGKLLGHNVRKTRSVSDSAVFIDNPMKRGVIGITKKRKADIAWVYSDTLSKYPIAYQSFPSADTIIKPAKWKMQTALGGGPIILQNGKVVITNNEEKMFAGKAIQDKHPRTCVGYTADNKLVIMVIQGRFPGKAEGATLEQEARLLQQFNCIEGLNLDGGGSSCMLINGKQTIEVTDKEGQRPVPAVLLISIKK